MSESLTTPYDLAAERAVLGACIIDRDAITAVRDVLSVEDFYLERHGVIFDALIDLLTARIPPDFVTLTSKLEEKQHLQTAGGLVYLSELTESVPTAVHVLHYAQRVIQTSAQRRVIQLGAEVQLRARQGGDVRSLFDELRAMVALTEDASIPKAKWEESVVPARLLYGFKFDPTLFIVDEILPEGTMLITGKPKTRKSWLALNFGWAVGAGGKALGRYQALQGDVLYIDLEMGQKRLHKRLHVVSPDQKPPQGFQFATSWPRVGEGFETWVKEYMKSHPFTRLIVVDTLIGIRPRRARSEDPYEADKSFTQALTNLCHDHHIAMVLIHHSRKADGSDITDDATGSTGLTGGVDNYAALRLSRTEKGMGEFLLTGRDIEIDGDLTLKWDSRFAQWNAIDAEPVQNLTPERRDVLGLLEDRPGLKIKEVALLLKRDEGGTSRLLSEMKKAGLVFNSSGRWWANEADGEE